MLPVRFQSVFLSRNLHLLSQLIRWLTGLYLRQRYLCPAIWRRLMTGFASTLPIRLCIRFMVWAGWLSLAPDEPKKPIAD